MAILCILCIFLGIGGIIWGIAQNRLRVKEDELTRRENEQLQELNKSLKQTRTSL